MITGALTVGGSRGVGALRRTRWLTAVAAATTCLCVAAAVQGQQPAGPARRIVSLVPAVTQMLFAIGAGGAVVGVSSYDREPPAVESLPRVGALLDPDLERILTLRPDLVVTYGSQSELRQQLARSGIAAFPYSHGGLADVSSTIELLGSRTGHVAEARSVVASIARDLEAVRARVAGRPRPRVLLVFGRDPQSLRNIYVSGGIGFLHDLLLVAGGANVMADVRREGLQVSTEQVLARAPDAIVEIRAEGLSRDAEDDAAAARDQALRAWSSLGSVPAVRTRRVHVLVGADLVVPGPHVARISERIAHALHGQ